jgi:hypothetical protein
MSNMTVNQRNQFDRVELSVPTTGVGVRDNRRMVAFTVVATLLVAVLVLANLTLIEGWAQAIVFGFILLTAVGAMIAVSPSRRS